LELLKKIGGCNPELIELCLVEGRGKAADYPHDNEGFLLKYGDSGDLNYLLYLINKNGFKKGYPGTKA
jgi:hypothetical protein